MYVIAGNKPPGQTDCTPDRHESDRHRGRFALFLQKYEKKAIFGVGVATTLLPVGRFYRTVHHPVLQPSDF